MLELLTGKNLPSCLLSQLKYKCVKILISYTKKEYLKMEEIKVVRKNIFFLFSLKKDKRRVDSEDIVEISL